MVKRRYKANISGKDLYKGKAHDNDCEAKCSQRVEKEHRLASLTKELVLAFLIDLQSAGRQHLCQHFLCLLAFLHLPLLELQPILEEADFLILAGHLTVTSILLLPQLIDFGSGSSSLGANLQQSGG